MLLRFFYSGINLTRTRQILHTNTCYTVRAFSGTLPSQTETMIDILKKKFPAAKNVEVADVSGGCGAMYEVLVESTEFRGLSIVKQHRLITDTLKQQIKEMHGLRIHTIVPKQ